MEWPLLQYDGHWHVAASRGRYEDRGAIECLLRPFSVVVSRSRRAFALGFVFKPNGPVYTNKKSPIPESAPAYSGSGLSYAITVLSFFLVYWATTYSQPPGYWEPGARPFSTFVIPAFAAFGAYEIAGFAGIKFRWRDRWAPAEIARLERWRDNLPKQVLLLLSIGFKAARFTLAVVLLACAGASLVALWSGDVNQARFQENHDQRVRQVLHARQRTGLYGKKKVHFGDYELASFWEWKSNRVQVDPNGARNDASDQAKQNAILNHLRSPGVKEIAGTYRGYPATHVVDPVNRRCVVLVERGKGIEFTEGLELSADQLESLLKTGDLPKR